MSKDTKRILFLVKSFKINTLEAYLEKMAEKGWMFTRKKGPLLYFKKCAPSKIHFTVDIFNEASSSDIRPTPYSEEYVSFCEESGWTLIQNSGKLMIFYSAESNPVPIQTEPALKLKTIIKYSKSDTIFPFCLLMFLFLVSLITGITSGMGPSYYLVVSKEGILLPLYLLFSILFGFDVFQLVVFYRKNKRRIKNGEDLIFESSKPLIIIKRVYAAILFPVVALIFILSICRDNTDIKLALVSCVAYAIIMLLIECFRQGNSRLGEGLNQLLYWSHLVLFFIIIIIVAVMGFNNRDSNAEHLVYTDKNNSVETTIYHEKIPFTLEDLGVTVNDAVHVETCAIPPYEFNIFGKYAQYCQLFLSEKLDYIGDGMECNIIESRFSFIIDDFIRDKLKIKWTKWHKDTGPELNIWGAEELYIGESKDNVVYRIVKWKNRALSFYGPDVKINEKTIAIIKKNADI